MLAQCCTIADEGVAEPYVNLGYLSGSNRTSWSEAYSLIRAIPAGFSALDVISSAAILLCLDDVKTVQDVCTSTLLWHGGEDQAKNRYFDKPVQLVVTDNGNAGLLGEHR